MNNWQRTVKFFSHLGFRSNVLLVSLADLSAWVGFCISSSQQCVKYQLWYLDFFFEVTMHIPWQIGKRGKVLSHLGFWSKILLGGFLYLKPTAECQISNLIFGFFWGPYKYPMTNWQRTAKFFLSLSLPRPLADLSAWVGFCTSNP
jgi:hypothetical protein